MIKKHHYLRWIVIFLSVMFRTIGVWRLGYVPFTITDKALWLFHNTPSWFLMWIKGIGLTLLFAFTLLIFTCSTLVTYIALRKDTRNESQKKHDNYYGNS